MRILFFIALLASTVSFADSKNKVNLKPTGESLKHQNDPGSATNLLYVSPKKLNTGASGEKKEGIVTMTSTCTDPLGMNFQPSDPGYEACLRTVDKAAPTGSQQKGKQSIGFTIK